MAFAAWDAELRHESPSCAVVRGGRDEGRGKSIVASPSCGLQLLKLVHQRIVCPHVVFEPKFVRQKGSDLIRSSKRAAAFGVSKVTCAHTSSPQVTSAA